MGMKAFDVFTLVVAGLMVGNELTVALFLHPTLSRMRDEVHIVAAVAFAGLFGRVMPFWYALVLALSLLETWIHWDPNTAATKWSVASTLLFLIAIVYTLIWPAPLNRRIAAWQTISPPASWQADRQRWDRMHVVRMGILLPALACLIAGVVWSRCP
jgi:hypothetical protein